MALLQRTNPIGTVHSNEPKEWIWHNGEDCTEIYITTDAIKKDSVTLIFYGKQWIFSFHQKYNASFLVFLASQKLFTKSTITFDKKSAVLARGKEGAAQLCEDFADWSKGFVADLSVQEIASNWSGSNVEEEEDPETIKDMLESKMACHWGCKVRLAHTDWIYLANMSPKSEGDCPTIVLCRQKNVPARVAHLVKEQV